MASRVAELRKKAVVTAAGAAVLGAAPTLAMTHGHRWLGLLAIGIQVVLIAVATRYLVEMKKAKAAGE